MPFKLVLTEMTAEEITPTGPFKDLVIAQLESYEHPYTQLLNLFFPLQNQTPEARTKRINDMINTQIHEHKKSPASRWIKAVDTETGEIAGGAQWFIFEENPYDPVKMSDEELMMWDAGEDRDFATALFSQFLAARMTWMQKPHIHLEACFTRPKYRRQGLGKLLMDWGIQKADEMKLESFIDATELGALLYTNYGFLSPGWVEIKAPVNENPSARWKELEEVLLPLSLISQWRPVGGKLGMDAKKPWE